MLPTFSTKAIELSKFWEDQLRSCGNEDCKMKFNITEDFMRTVSSLFFLYIASGQEIKMTARRL
jgi:hypothetical protein